MSDLPRRSRAAQASAVRMSNLKIAVHDAIAHADHDELLTDTEIATVLTDLLHTMVHQWIRDERERTETGHGRQGA